MATQEYSLTQIGTDFMYRVFGWMSLGLALTGITPLYLSFTGLGSVFTQPRLVLIILALEISLVIALNFFLPRLSYVTAVIAFIVYSLFTGFTFSVLFLLFTQVYLVSIFFIAASMFAALALYGYLTHSDLTSTDKIVLMAVIGLIIGLAVNLLLKSPLFNFIFSALAILVIVSLAAYHMPRIKHMSYMLLNQGNTIRWVSVTAALAFYLDFFNFFLPHLKFTGKRR